MELVKFNDPLITSATTPFDFANPVVEPLAFAQELIAKIYQLKAYGLSVNQIGLSFSCFGMKGSPNFVCFNPRIVDKSSHTETLEEACLTFPGLFFDVERPSVIKVRFQTPNGETRTEKFTGLTARIFQHEMQHLNGEVFFKGKSRTAIELAVRRSKKIGVNYPVGELYKMAKI